MISTIAQNRTTVELNVKKEPQLYNWSNKGLNYQTEFIKLKCHTGKYCRVQVFCLNLSVLFKSFRFDVLSQIFLVCKVLKLMFTVLLFFQVKFMTIDFGGDQNTEIKMYHDFDMTKFPFISLTASTYSAIRELDYNNLIRQ